MPLEDLKKVTYLLTNSLTHLVTAWKQEMLAHLKITMAGFPTYHWQPNMLWNQSSLELNAYKSKNIAKQAKLNFCWVMWHKISLAWLKKLDNVAICWGAGYKGRGKKQQEWHGSNSQHIIGYHPFNIVLPTNCTLQEKHTEIKFSGCLALVDRIDYQ